MKKLICIIITFVLFFSLSLSVSAEGSSGSVTVTGELYHNITEYDVTYDTMVNWYVTADSDRKVWNSIDGIDENCHKITNNIEYSGVRVSLDCFTCESVSDYIKENLTLKLTGSLAEGDIIGKDLSGGCDDKYTYEKVLEYGDENVWEYGFTGEYTGYLSKTVVEPVYCMNLSFELL